MWKPVGLSIDRWGPSLWNWLHVVAHTYPVKPTQQQRMEAQIHLRMIAERIPCPTCRVHFHEFLNRRLDDAAVSTRAAYVALMNDAHNEVNARTGKRCYTLEEHYRMYTRSRKSNPSMFLCVLTMIIWAVFVASSGLLVHRNWYRVTRLQQVSSPFRAPPEPLARSNQT